MHEAEAVIPVMRRVRVDIRRCHLIVIYFFEVCVCVCGRMSVTPYEVCGDRQADHVRWAG